MRVRVAVIALLVGAACCAAGVSIARPARAATHVTIPVIRCPTSFGVAPGRITVRRDLTLRGVPASTARLTAYTNTSGYLVGPPHLRCAGVVDADGNSTIQAWPSGQAQPGPHSAGAGLALSVIPACVGCKAEATCHYFPTFWRAVRRIGLICRPEPPPGEQLRYLNERLVAFVDPPFVKGAGWPSGAGLSATGLVGIRPGASQVVFTSSCTLPAAQRAVCVDSADAERRLSG
ncbi:MAG: hypothetical protein WAL22_11055 [Solirubrobacteraceae bacterium]